MAAGAGVLTLEDIHVDTLCGTCRVTEMLVDALGAPVHESLCAGCWTERQVQRMKSDGVLLTLDDLDGLPRIEPLIMGYLSQRETVVLAGKHGSMKSFLVLDWGMSVACGRRWQGNDVTQAPVLYVVKEGVNGLRDRRDAWTTAWNQPRPAGFHIMRAKANLWDAGNRRPAFQEVETLAKYLGAKMVIFDTLSSLFGGARDSDGEDMSALTSALDDLREAIDGTVVLVHHTGWGNDGRVRGSTVLEANVDAVINVAKDGSVMTVKSTKNKNGSPWGIRLAASVVALGDDERGDPRTSLVLQASRKSDINETLHGRVLNALPESPESVSTAQVMKALEIEENGRTTVSRMLNTLIKEGAAASAGKRGPTPLYSLAPTTAPDLSTSTSNEGHE
jgi:hypothetical protein